MRGGAAHSLRGLLEHDILKKLKSKVNVLQSKEVRSHRPLADTVNRNR